MMQAWYAQYPHYFSCDNENGLPSNEVYSLLQDKKGFIWFGCDAGLYKFDGVSYILYKSGSQKSRSVSGLTRSASGRLYCLNFQSQLFYLDQDSMKELRHAYSKISNIICDLSGHLMVSHQDGLAVYDEVKNQWRNFSNFGIDISNTWKHFTKSVRVNSKNKAYFLNTAGVGVYADNKVQAIKSKVFQKEAVGTLLLECVNDKIWIFSVNKNVVYTSRGNTIEEYKSKSLPAVLIGKKITNVKYLADGNLWIFTYSGLVCYHVKKDSAIVYYPNLSFSDGVIDREGNYWFSTLQSGIIRVADLQFIVWNNFANKRLTKITENEESVFFSTVNGTIGRLNKRNGELKLVDTGSNGDIQCLNYEADESSLYYFTNANLYAIRNDNIHLILQSPPSTKFIKKIAGSYFLCSSFGTYVYDLKTGKELEKLNSFWSRKTEYDEKNKRVWIATNEGLLKYRGQGNKWVQDTLLLLGTQIVSSDLDVSTGQIFALSFDGKIYSFSPDNKKELLNLLSDEVQAYSIKHHKGTTYLATNKGLLYFTDADKQIKRLNLQSGLTSEHIQDFIISDQHIFLATSQGLQKVPLLHSRTRPACIIYLKNRGNQGLDIQLKHRQSLILYPEVNAFSSNGKHRYAYRIKSLDKQWIELPGNTKEISIQNIPSGNFEVELKAIDYFGKDSENTLLLKGYVQPPFWLSWWFLLAISGLLFLSIRLFFKNRISKLKRKQLIEIERMTLENELRLSQQSAIKAQMNPHFIFNVLNSIKGYIYENDKKNATLYLNRFSELIRKILQQSSEAQIKLEEEIEFLKVYIELEAMLLEGQFEYSITVDKDIQTKGIKIPGLLIQPFIENAFKHGLRNKTGAKRLEIVFAMENNNLLVSVSDNGIGRKAATKVNELKMHPSFASGALLKRINLLNHEKREVVGLEIIDLHDEKNRPTGTKVILRIITES